MMDEADLIEKVRECKTKVQLFALMEEESNNDMKFWGENNYKAARGFLKRAMGNPETHYGPQHGHLSEEEMFYMDVEMFLSRNWECAVNLKAVNSEKVDNWDDLVVTGGPKGITACDIKIEPHKVYRIYPHGPYNGYSLIAADSVDEANKAIEEFRNSDPHNDLDSYGYSDVSEADLEEDLFSTRLGFVIQGIYYTGN